MSDLQAYGVVLAGGSGTRFWPASRKSRPKQLLALGPGSDSLIARTVRRIEPLCPASRVYIATGAHLLDATRRELPWLPEPAFLGEPSARNTAPCIGWATAVIHRRDPDALVAVLPSDQHIGDVEAYLAAVSLALQAARDGTITTIGLTPTRPETGYGYIEAGADRSPGVRAVVRFTEKPDRPNAERYLASGRHYWNSGMFFFRAADMLAALAEHAPDVYRGVECIEAAARDGGAREQAAVAEAFAEMPSVSIDYAVMEHLAELAVVPADFGWSDLGSWESAWELGQKDERGNVAEAGHVIVDGGDNLVHLSGAAQGKLVALVGVRGLCVVDTGDVLLVMPKERSQDVRSVVSALESRGQRDRL